jgi:hypothetical protein
VTCPVTVTSHEWLWLRNVKCGEPIARDGLCAHHASERARLLEAGGMSAHLALVDGEAS